MECGCPEIGGHTPYCLIHTAPPARDPVLLTGTDARGGDPACGHDWIQVRSKGWLLKAVCACKATRRFTAADFNQVLAAGRMTLLPRRA